MGPSRELVVSLSRCCRVRDAVRRAVSASLAARVGVEKRGFRPSSRSFDASFLSLSSFLPPHHLLSLLHCTRYRPVVERHAFLCHGLVVFGAARRGKGTTAARPTRRL